jgi:glutaredoxin
MKPENIRLFIKPYCGWCTQAMDWLESRGVTYEKLDVITDGRAYNEMRDLSGQTMAPVIDVDGEILADFGVEELEAWWKEQGLDGEDGA